MAVGTPVVVVLTYGLLSVLAPAKRRRGTARRYGGVSTFCRAYSRTGLIGTTVS